MPRANDVSDGDARLWRLADGQQLAGLTGGIASGKSFVARIFRELGAAVIDADRLARQVVVPGEPAYKQVVARFGDAVVAPGGELDRECLARIVFNDAKQRRILEEIMHPAVFTCMQKELAAFKAAAAPQVVVVDIPLLFETGMQEFVRPVVCVTVSAEVQLQRLMQRDGIDAQAARLRIAAQLPLVDKTRRADHVIKNDGPREATRLQVVELYQRWTAALNTTKGGP